MARMSHAMTTGVPVAEGKGETRQSKLRFLAISALVGIGAGSLGTVFHLVVDFLVRWPNWLMDNHGTGAGVMAASAVITAAMATVSVMIVRRFAPEAAGSGVQEIEGALELLRPFRWKRVLPVKLGAGILSLSSGLVLGREGPTIHIGACVAGALSDWGKVDPLERRGLIAAGAAAGLAAAFNAPMASVLFVIEETRRQFPYTFKTYAGVIIACTLSGIMTEDIAGVGPDLSITVAATPLWALLAFAALGVLLGGMGVLFNAMLLRGLDLAASLDERIPYVAPVTVGLVIGVLLIVLPEATRGNEGLILQMIAQHNSVLFLFGVVAVRLITSPASYSTGVPGGIFAPILTLAASSGLAIGALVSVFLPESQSLAVAFSVAAMGGLFTASIRAPMVGAVLVLELTGAFEILLPVLVTCATAHVAADMLGGRPIYEQLLDRTLKRAGIERPARQEREPTGLA
jgi:chloride channel protein, CIC family